MSDPEELIKEAERKAKTGFLVSLRGGPRYDEANELYNRAANEYKLRKKWDLAASSYAKAAEAARAYGDSVQEGHDLTEAGNALRKVDPDLAIPYFEQACQIYVAKGRFSCAGRIMKTQAEEYDSVPGKEEQAAMFWKKAGDLYLLDEFGKSSYIQCISKYADIIALNSDRYDEAIKINEECGQMTLKNNLTAYGAKEHFFKAGLLTMAKGDPITASCTCQEYVNLDSRLGSSREMKLLKELCQSFEEDDIDKFTKALSDFDRVTRLDDWKVHLLTKIKNGMRGSHKMNHTEIPAPVPIIPPVTSEQTEQEVDLT